MVPLHQSVEVRSDIDDATLVHAAARNNAELCDHVCRAHGLDAVFATDAWTSARRTPQYYPDAVTLEPGADAAALLARIDGSSGASVKDSFASLDLRSDGFRIVFAADWIGRPSDSSTTNQGDSGLRWSTVGDADELVAWEAAWTEDGPARGLFRPALLGGSELDVLQGKDGSSIVAGAIVNRAGNVVGISNLFTRTGELAGGWAGCLEVIAKRFPGLAIVGYEADGALDAAHGAGFRSIGALRIWIKD